MKQIIYSILQYRHSLLRDETFNIGIAFYLPEIDNKIVFYPSPRIDILQSIYTDIDFETLTNYIKYIRFNIDNNEIERHPSIPFDLNFRLYLKKSVLLEDATVLQFSDPVVISNVDNSEPIEILKNYIHILLSFKDNGEFTYLKNRLYS